MLVGYAVGAALALLLTRSAQEELGTAAEPAALTNSLDGLTQSRQTRATRSARRLEGWMSSNPN